MRRALISAAITAAGISLSAAPAWAATTAPQAVLPGQASYQVRPGDSYWSVSRLYGVTMQDLAAWNHTDLWAPLDTGWTLQIPPAGWHAPAAATQAAQTDSFYYSSASYGYTTGAHGYGSAPAGIWNCIAQLESGSNPATATGNGYYGMYQFTIGSWEAAGGTGNPADASPAEQTAVAQRVQQQQGWRAWPVTSRECGA